MDQHSIVLRPARPDFDEGLVFARYLDQAAEGFFRFMLGRRVARIIATAYAEPNHDLSYQNVTFAERDSVIVGMVSCFTAEQHRRHSAQPLRQAAGRRVWRMMVVRVLLAPLFRIIDSLPDGDFYLQAIAVDEALRGAGVGSILLDFAEHRARATGSARLTLDVSAKNQGAQRLYGRRGMTVDSGWPKLPLVPRIFVRMTRLL